MARQWQVNDAFGTSNLGLAEFDDPGTPPAGLVAVRWRAWSINYRDKLMIDGHYDPRLAFPFVPLSDAAGEVVDAEESTGFTKGDRVIPTFSPGWLSGPPDWDALRKTRGGTIPGVAATHQLMPPNELVRIPDHLTFAEAATLPCAAVTAYRALVELGGLQAG
ncbi:MAG: alcohol dehydrogenase catalytic domain-containing protein, partial [Myxococcota bacterium]